MKPSPLFTEDDHTPCFNATLNNHPTVKIQQEWKFSWDSPAFTNKLNPLVMPKQRKSRDNGV